MRVFILSLGFLLSGVWLNIVFNHYFQIGGLKINWLLMFMLVLTIRHSDVSLPFVGVFAGLFSDALSHGIMGIYGISFFVTLLLSRQLKNISYANTFFAVSLAVLAMSILEGWISLTIMGLLEPDFDQLSLVLSSTLPLAVLQGLLTPAIMQCVIWGETYFLKEVA